jgi:TPR repeat protein
MIARTPHLLSLGVPVAVALVVAGATTACGPSVASHVRGDAQSANAVMAGACGEEPQPWVIDVGSDSLSHDIQRAVSEGKPVLVKYDCGTRNVAIVRGCEVTGTRYKYQGFAYEQKQKLMEDSDQMAADLSGGPTVAAKFHADFEKGSVFQIDYAPAGEYHLVGKERVDRTMISGGKACAAATHFVYSADVGAYSLNSGAQAKVGAAAELFGRGVSGDSKSDVKNAAHGGDPKSCHDSSMDDAAAIKDCQVPLTLHLRPIDATEVTNRPPPPGHGFSSSACAPGEALDSHQSCIKISKGPAYQCSGNDVNECKAQCDKGSPQSCAIAGYIFEKGEGVKDDLDLALKYYTKACDGRENEGCAGIGYVLSKRKDPSSTDIFRKSCERGSARGCSGIGQQLRIKGDLVPAAKTFGRACGLGYKRACFYAGAMLSKLRQNPEEGFEFYQMACYGGDERGCLAAGAMEQDGVGTRANPGPGKALIERGRLGLEKECDEKHYESCEVLGDFWMGQFTGNAPTRDKARSYYDLACKGGSENACAELKGGSPPSSAPSPKPKNKSH